MNKITKSGIYCIVNLANEKRYVGQSVSIKKRIAEHLRHLRKGKHGCKHLQAAFNKYGELFFEYKILEICEKGELTKREQYWMDFFGYDETYNTAPAAGSNAGMKASEETRAKLSGENHPLYGKTGEDHPRYGKAHSAETRAKISVSLLGENNPNFGKSKTMEQRAKISAALIGNIITVATRAKLSAKMSGENNPNYGKTPTEETRAKMSASHKGHIPTKEHRAKLSAAKLGHYVSEETRAKVSAFHRGRVFTEEHRAHLSEAHKGINLTAETRAKMPEAAKRGWETRRERMAANG